MKKIDENEAQTEVSEARQRQQARRRVRSDSYADLRRYATEIIAWAKSSGATSTIVQELVERKFDVRISRYRLYRFVIAELGEWPNRRSRSVTGERNAEIS